MEKDQYIGRLLDGRYEILEAIGSGGMAVVYKAKCHRLNRMVAVKILKPEYARDEEFRRHFRAESQAVAMLSHPNIVSIYDVSSSFSAEYIVTELIDGITLKQYMEKKGVLNWKETLHFATQIAKALEHAHAKGIVHRDIKPHNVMVLKSGAIKVMDFGIAQTLTGDVAKTTEALGSVHYISPEQAKGARIDNRSDIYSLGVVMYEMITGRVPYDGDSPVNVAMQHITGGANPPSTINPNAPQGLERIIAKAMSLVPKNRYATATAMLYDLDAFRREAAKANEITPIQTAPVQTDVVKQTTVAQRQEARRNAQVAPARRPEDDDEDSGPSKATIVAIVACILAGLIAVTIFVILFIQSGVVDLPQKVEVPNLVGKAYATLQDVDGLLIQRQVDVVAYSNTVPAGDIIDQKPRAGEKVERGTTVYVTVSMGPKPPETVKMPYVVGMQFERARDILHNHKLYSVTKNVVTHWKPAGEVVNQSEEAYVEIGLETRIILEVSNGLGEDPNKPTTMPTTAPTTMPTTVPTTIPSADTSTEPTEDPTGPTLITTQPTVPTTEPVQPEQPEDPVEQ